MIFLHKNVAQKERIFTMLRMVEKLCIILLLIAVAHIARVESSVTSLVQTA